MTTQTQTSQGRAITLNRILMFIAFLCELIAAVSAANLVTQAGPALAWFFGGFAAFLLAGVV